MIRLPSARSKKKMIVTMILRTAKEAAPYSNRTVPTQYTIQYTLYSIIMKQREERRRLSSSHYKTIDTKQNNKYDRKDLKQ